MVQAVEDEKYFQQCPLYLATKIWDYFDRILELEDNEKKVYLEAKLPSTELSEEVLEEKVFHHDHMKGWLWTTGKLSRELYQYAIELLIELTSNFGNVLADNNRRWIVAFRTDCIVLVKVATMDKEEVREELLKVDDLGNVLKKMKSKGMHLKFIDFYLFLKKTFF